MPLIFTRKRVLPSISWNTFCQPQVVATRPQKIMITNLLSEMGLDVGVPIVRLDSDAGRALATRMGVGRQRHIHTRHLWLQGRAKASALTEADKVALLCSAADGDPLDESAGARAGRDGEERQQALAY